MRHWSLPLEFKWPGFEWLDFEWLGFNEKLSYRLGTSKNVYTSSTSRSVSSLSTRAWLGLVFRMGVDWLFFGHIFSDAFVACGERLKNSCRRSNP